MRSPTKRGDRLRLTGLIRITSGEFRGRALKVAGGAVHPMGARERLAALNSVAPLLDDATVLDVYAGTGALGLESISRRAARVTFVERSSRVAKVLQENIQMLGVERQCEVVVAPVVQYVATTLRERRRISFSVIFADPPYADYHPEDIQLLEQLLAPGGVMVLSHPKGSDIPQFHTLMLKSFHLHAGCRISVFGFPS